MPQSIGPTRRMLPIIVGLVALTLTGLTAAYVAWRAETRDNAYFRQAVTTANSQIESQVEGAIDILRGLKGYFDAEGRIVNRQNFTNYAEALELNKHHPEIRAIAFVPRVRPSERDSFIVEAKKDGEPDFSIHPPKANAEQFPVFLLHPHDDLNHHALGFDLFSEAVRRDAMERARDTGQEAVTGSVQLVQGMVRGPTGFLIFLPMYRDGAVPDELNDRQDLLCGFVCCVFRADALIASACDLPHGTPLRIRLFAGLDEGQSPLLHDSGAATSQPDAGESWSSDTDVVRVADRDWLVEVSLLNLKGARESVRAAVAVAVSGLFITSLLVGVTMLLTRSQRFVAHQGQELTTSREALHSVRALERQRTAELQLVIQAIPSPVWIAHDAECNLITGNQTASDIFGLPAGQNLGPRIHDPSLGYRFRIDGREVTPDELPMHSACRLGRLVPSRDVEIIGPDGVSRFVYGNAVPLFDEDGKVRGCIGTFIDLTDRSRAEQALHDQQRQLRTITDAVPVLIAYVDREQRYRFVNRQYETMFGLSREHMEGRTIAEILGTESYAEIKPHIDEVLVGHEVKYNRWLDFRAKGQRCVEVQYIPHSDSTGLLLGFYVMVLDVTEKQQAQERIARSEQRYRLAARATSDAIWDWDFSTHRVNWSEALREQFGYLETETPIDWWTDRIHADDRDRVNQSISDVVRGDREHWEAEYRFLRADGSVALVLDRGYVVRGQDGRVERMLGAMTDQTERKSAEEVMQRMVRCAQATSQEFFEAAVRALSELTGCRYCMVGELLEDRPDHIRVVASWMTGESGKPVEYALPGTPCEHVVTGETCFFESGVATKFPQDVMLADLAVESYLGTPLHDSDGTTIGILVAMHDQPKVDLPRNRSVLELLAGRAGPELQRQRITDQLADSNQQLSRRLAELEAWFQTSPVGLAIAEDPECRHIRNNPALANLLGLPQGENASKSGPNGERLPFMFLRDGHEIPADQLPMQQCARLGASLAPEELDVWRSDGQVYRLMVYTTPLFDEAGAVRGCLSAHVDITERTRAEQRLMESRQRFRQLADAMPQVVWTATPDGLIDYINQRALELTGHPPDQPVGQLWINYVHADDREHAVARWMHSVTTGEPYQIEFRLGKVNDTAHRWHLGRAVAVSDGGGRIVRWYGTCTDIEDQKRTQDALQQSQEQYRASFEMAGVGKSQSDPVTGRFERVNRMLCEITGFSEEELLEKTFSEITLPEDRPADMDEFDRMVRGETTGYAIEKRYRRRDGSVAWVQVNTTLVRDAEERPLHTIAVIQDVTARKIAETELERHRQRLEELVAERTEALEDSHERLRASERMASIGSLAAGLGHDMGNLVLPVMCRLETLAMLDLPPLAKEEIAAVQNTMTYLRQLSAGLRLFALDPNDSAASSVHSSIDSWWNEVRNLIVRAVPKGLEVETEFEDDLPRVTIAPHQLTQAVLNLVTNAGDAIVGAGMEPAAGRIKVWAERIGNGSQVEIGVTDNGPGMTAEVRRRATDPFFTTKKRGLSTGLGLSLVHSVTQAVGGELDIQSTPGRGTTITMRLPAVKSPTGKAIDGTGHAARVALNDPRMASYTATLLRSNGFDVYSNGPATLGGESLVVTEPGVYDVQLLRNYLRGERGRRVILVIRGGADVDALREPGIVVIDGSHRSMHEAIRLTLADPSPPVPVELKHHIPVQSLVEQSEGAQP